jgi:hypothetical protein
MKLTHKLCGAALLAAVGVAVAIPNTTKAVDHSLDGKGHIGFTKDTGTKTLTDPGSTDSSAVVITSNSTLPVTDPGDFGIIAVTPLEFRSHSVLTTDESFNASLYEANGSDYNPAAPSTTKDIQNFVAFYDGREGARTYGLSAKSTEFKDGTKVLGGTEITYSNIWVSTHAGGEAPDTLGASQVLKTTGASTKFISNNVAAGGTQGFGQHEINFGEVSKNGAVGGADQAVTLSVPKADNPVIVSGDYNAVITWTLSETL